MKIKADDFSGRLGVSSFAYTKLGRVLTRLPTLSAAGPWIAGGAVRRTIQGEALSSDFDFFFANEEQANAFESAMDAAGAAKTTSTTKSCTFMLPGESPAEGVYLPEIKVQSIRFQFFSDPEAVIDAFDFTLSQFAYDGESVYVGPFSLWDVARRRIVIHRISYGVSSVRRLMKYAAQGYTVCSGALAEILRQVVADPTVIQSDTEYVD